MSKSQESKEHNITGLIIKNKDIVYCIAYQQTNHYRFLSYCQIAFYNINQRNDIEHKIQSQSQNSSSHKPIKINTMSSVEPLLMRPHAGIIIFIENIIKVFLTNSYNSCFYTFKNAIYSHRPDKTSGLGFCITYRYARYTSQYLIFLYPLRVSIEIK